MKFIDEHGKVRNYDTSKELSLETIFKCLLIACLLAFMCMATSCRVNGGLSFYKRGGTGAYCPR
jgi:hypothetical protein